ncbi:BTB/POZ domain-containing protein At1g03010 isoform X2 [Cryptomeria japonica]|uniref:BTB/POZ domain-containing protein At1g03010 isoform X2 n=1 Tax=Cryptomeria japonica TaxID=3369 RepID=UPI0025ABB603|nr:BTB/POZ domain-containing protein At1g03010 isoform X2 [Cryptomeria japonica]
MALHQRFEGTHTSLPLLSDVPSDISVEAGENTFALHKFPLVSKSGRIRKQLAESKDATRLHLQDMPGGAEAFELAAKFCYGGNPEITASNVAMLRCAASYLEMTDHYTDGSLEKRTETFLKEIVFHSLPDSVTVLYSCESLLPFAEDLKIITRCIEAITSAASNEELKRGLSRLTSSGSQSQWAASQDYTQNQQSTKPMEAESESWWGKELAILNIHMFQRVVTAMKSKGLGHDIISGVLMHYAKHSLEPYYSTNSTKIPPMDAPKIAVQIPSNADPDRPRFKSRGPGAPSLAEREKRSVVETVVSLLPPQMKRIPVSFLSWLLRAAMMLNVTASYRTELEKRFGSRLDQAAVDDLLIPAYSSYKDEGQTLYDTDVVLRIVANFLQFVEEGEAEWWDGAEERVNREIIDGYESDSPTKHTHNHKQNHSMVQVSKLMDTCLAEIAPDPNLSISTFIALAEAVPQHARLVDDGLYRAIDIFLKAHPTIKEMERNKLCKLLDCQKLSHDACTHAAQNERLPVQLAVQVLYFEQLRLRTAMNGDPHHPHRHHHHSYQSEGPSASISPRDNYASVRRENRELKLEVARMRMRLTDLEKNHVSMKQELVKTTPPHKFLQSFSKTLSKLNSLFRAKDNSINPLFLNNNNNLMSRRRRHSIS